MYFYFRYLPGCLSITGFIILLIVITLISVVWDKPRSTTVTRALDCVRGAAECERKNKSDPNLKCTVEEMENHNNYCHGKNISQ